MTLFLLILGIAGLWIASEIAISGALDIAEHYRVSRGFVGLTVLAIGTDVPELFVSMKAAIERLGGTETSGFILGQTVGTCFGQAALMMGLAGLVATLAMKRKNLLRDGLVLIAAAVLLFLLGYDGEISRVDGGLLLIVYLIYFVSLIREEKVREKLHLPVKVNLPMSVLYMIGGLVLLGFAADMTVENALHLSVQWGIAQSVVGALIVGIGTSLPEFATSMAALKKGQGELAVGNLIGSTTFDILVALGGAAVVSGLVVSRNLLYFDFIMLILLTLLVFFVLWSRSRLSRREAAFLLIAYIIFAGAKLGGTV
jgi:cation:H+ antiporter